MLLFLLVISFLSVVTSFGTTYLLLRTTPYARYSVVLSLVFSQVLFLCSVTLLGYRIPLPLSPSLVIAMAVGGILLSIIVTLRYRIEVLTLLRETWRESTFMLGLAVSAGILATPIIIASASPAYIDWRSEEMTNFTILAHYLLGVIRNPGYLSFCLQNFELRYGAIVMLSAASTLTGKAPLLLVDIIAAFFKFSAIISFAVGFDLVRKERGMRPWACAIVTSGFAFSAILSLNHVLPFLAAQAVTGSCILLTLGMLSEGIKNRRIQLFFALQVLFIVITYAESLPFLALAAGIIFLEAIFNRKKETVLAIAIIFAGGFLLNPIVLASRIDWILKLRNIVAGFNVLGSPKEDLVGYLAAVLGFRYPFVNIPPLPHNLVTGGIILGILVLTCAFLVASFEMKSLLFLAVPIVLVLVHFTNDQPAGLAYYKSYKTIAALYFYLFVALGFLLERLFHRWPSQWPFPVVRIVLLAGISLLTVVNLIVSNRATAAIKSIPTVYNEVDFQQALTLANRSDGALTVLSHGTDASTWDLVLNHMNTKLRILDTEQAKTVYHIDSPTLTEQPIFSKIAVQPLASAEPSRDLRRNIVIPKIAHYPPGQGPEIFNVRAFLESIGPGVRLIEGKTLQETEAFRLVEGRFIETGDSKVAADGSQNLPPNIVGVSPTAGQGPNGLVSITYSDPNGAPDLLAALTQIYSEKNPQPNECYISFSFGARQLGLVLDEGKWGTEMLGSNRSLENKNCLIDTGHSSVTVSGNEISLHLAMVFKPAFRGRKVIATTIYDSSRLIMGPKPVGSWTVQ